MDNTSKQWGAARNAVRKNPCDVSDSLTGVSFPLATSGESLRWVRQTVSLPQTSMAAKAGLAEGTLSEMENGLVDPKPPQLAAVHGAAMDELADRFERYAMLLRYLRRSMAA